MSRNYAGAESAEVVAVHDASREAFAALARSVAPRA
jgi:hypothetical protein